MSDSIDRDLTEEAEPGDASGAPAAQSTSGDLNEERVRLALRKVKDPELNLNIVDLGLVYEVMVDEGNIQVGLTLTSPGCPAGPTIMTDVERALRALPGVTDVAITLVWSPMWTPDRIEPRVRAYMGL